MFSPHFLSSCGKTKACHLYVKSSTESNAVRLSANSHIVLTFFLKLTISPPPNVPQSAARPEGTAHEMDGRL